MVKVGIIGPTGYVSGKLARLLLQREDTEMKWYGPKSYVDQKYASIYQNVFQIVDDVYVDDNMKELANQVNVIFMVTPQGFCASLADEEIPSKARTADSSADSRIKDVNAYEEWYKIRHPAPKYIEEMAYGLLETNREKIKTTGLIANPSRYPTCSTLAIYPLMKEGLINTNTITIDTKSDVLGAGRGARVGNLYYEVDGSCKACGVASHRYTPEIEEQLPYAAEKPVTLSFTPHPTPMNRETLITAYVTLVKVMSYDEVKVIYDKYYAGEQSVRMLEEGTTSQTCWVEGSNFVDASFRIDTKTDRVVMMDAIDNMVKGAAGQAIQDINLRFGLPENTELKQIPLFPQVKSFTMNPQITQTGTAGRRGV